MNKYLKASILLVLLGGLSYLLTSIIIEANKTEPHVFEPPVVMPAFNFELLDGTPFTTDDLPKDKPVSMVFFDPTCDHCIKQGRNMSDSIDLFGEGHILFISMEETKEIKAYSDSFSLGRQPNVDMLHDPNYLIWETFRPSVFPSVIVYSSEGKRLQFWNGMVAPSVIAEAFKLN